MPVHRGRSPGHEHVGCHDWNSPHPARPGNSPTAGRESDLTPLEHTAGRAATICRTGATRRPVKIGRVYAVGKVDLRRTTPAGSGGTLQLLEVLRLGQVVEAAQAEQLQEPRRRPVSHFPAV